VENPKVSIIIPTYNRANYLEQAINSVLAQTFQDYELVVLDNASTDNTSEVVRKFRDERFQYIKNEINIGPINNFNKGLKVARGDFVIIFHDDDIMAPELVEEEVKILNENEDVVLVASNVELIDEKGKTIQNKLLSIDQDIIFEKYEYIVKRLKNDILLPCPSVMLRKNFLDVNNLIFESEKGPAADTYLWFKINLSDKLLYLVSRPLLKYRIHSGQDSFRNDYYVWLSHFRISHDIIANNNLYHLVPELKIRASNFLVKILFVQYLFNRIDKDNLKNALYNLRKEKFWSDKLTLDTKILILLSQNFPKLAKNLVLLRRIVRKYPAFLKRIFRKEME